MSEVNKGGTNAPKLGEQGFQKSKKGKKAPGAVKKTKLKEFGVVVTELNVEERTPAEVAFENFLKTKTLIRETELEIVAKAERESLEAKEIQDNIHNKMEKDTILVEDLLWKAVRERAVSKYIAQNYIQGDSRSSIGTIRDIVEPVGYVKKGEDERLLNLSSLERFWIGTIRDIVEPVGYVKKGEDERYPNYEEGHDPIIRGYDGFACGFIKGDDQDRVNGQSERVQAIYETWVSPLSRGQGLELKAINRAIEAKIDRANASSFDFHVGTFQAIVWEGNGKMAVDLIADGWIGVLPTKEDAGNDDKQRFHLFTKTFKF